MKNRQTDQYPTARNSDLINLGRGLGIGFVVVVCFLINSLEGSNIWPELIAKSFTYENQQSLKLLGIRKDGLICSEWRLVTVIVCDR